MKITMKKIKSYLKDPSKILLYIINKDFFWWLNDRSYLKLKFKLTMKSKLNLEKPETLNEKIQWLKLYDRNPEYTRMVDKYESKQYVKEKLGEEYVIPLLGVYEKFDDIDFNKLPDKFVIKCTHDCGGLIVCKDKSKLDIKKAKRKINKSLKRNYYYHEREWPYKDIKPRIIIEQYMEDDLKKELIDYKMFCFNGKVKVIFVCSNRFVKLRETLFDENWNILDCKVEGYDIDETLTKPYNLEKMKEIAEELSKDIRFVRVDFYEVNKKIYMGEFTFYPDGGVAKYTPEGWDKKLGDLLDLRI